MKKLLFAALLASFFLTAEVFCAPKGAPETLYQLSTLNALIEGVYDGDLTCRELKKKGDFGIGTFNGLDGEMIILDGAVYRISSDGKASAAPPDDKTPFVIATFFKTDISHKPESGMNFKRLKEFTDFSLPTKNIIYAVKVTGNFAYVKTRSVPKQSKPYPKLTAVTEKQPVFELKKVKGTLIGFRFPEYMNGVNLPGYHFHFISDDKTSGGHVLDVVMADVKVEIDGIHTYALSLPNSEDFYSADISGKAGQAERVEKQVIQQPKAPPAVRPKKTNLKEEEYH